MAHDGAVGPDHVTADEAESLLDESPDLRGIHRLEYLEVVRLDKLRQLEADATQHQLALLNEDDQPGKLLEGPEAD